MTLALDRLKPLLDGFAAEIAHMGNFPSLFLATVNREGGLEYYDGMLRMVDEAGNPIAEDLKPARIPLHTSAKPAKTTRSSNSPSTGHWAIRTDTIGSARSRA